MTHNDDEKIAHAFDSPSRESYSPAPSTAWSEGTHMSDDVLKVGCREMCQCIVL